MKTTLLAATVLALALPISSVRAWAAGTPSPRATTATALPCTPAAAASGVSTVGAIADCNSSERLPDFEIRHGNADLSDQAHGDEANCCP